MTKQRAIYLNCLDCAGGSPKEVTLCVLFDCPLWEYRSGYHISSGRYRKRIQKAFSKNTEDIRGLRREEGLDMADYLLEHKQACVFSAKGRKKDVSTGPTKGRHQKEGEKAFQGARV